MVRVFENRVLWKIFGPKRDEITGDWRKIHNEELHDLFFSSHVIRMIKSVAYLGLLFGGGVQQIQLRTEDRGRGSGGGSPLLRSSGGSCNLVQEISFHIVKFS